MTLTRKRFIQASLLQLLLWVALGSAVAQQSTLQISSREEITAEFGVVPCKNQERQSAVKALFEKAGALPADVSIDKFKDVENLVVTIKGASPGIIVLGAHYDKVEEGCGALDNWTGIIALVHLYKSLKNSSPQKTIILVAFGKEERGLIGSHAMVEAIDKVHLGEYCAMINLDSFGLAVPQVMDNASSKKLGELAAEIANDMKIPFNHSIIPGAGADSMSFLAKKIPAITIHGMNNDWPRILHSSEDKVSKVNPTSVYLGYRLALTLITRVDAASCAAYR